MNDNAALVAVTIISIGAILAITYLGRSRSVGEPKGIGDKVRIDGKTFIITDMTYTATQEFTVSLLDQKSFMRRYSR